MPKATEAPQPEDAMSRASGGSPDCSVADNVSDDAKDLVSELGDARDVTDGDLALLRTEVSMLASEMRRYHDLIERLHAHNEELRRGLLERTIEPIFRDLIKLLEDYRRLKVSWTDRKSAEPTDVERICIAITGDIDMLLERYGVEQSSPEPGTLFDRREHRAVATTPTTDVAQDATVQSTRSQGYRVGNRILRFPEVVVYHIAQPQSPDIGSNAREV